MATDARGHDLRIEPNTDLVPEQVVDVSGPFDPAAVIGVGVCAEEAVSAAPERWCDVNIDYSVVDRGGESRLSVKVVRSIDTAEGFVDCGERRARCLVGVRAGGDFFAPVSFQKSVSEPVSTSVAVDRTTVSDGDPVVVRGGGFVPGDEVYLQQCLGPVGSSELRPGATWGSCDQARSVTVVADGAGVIEVTFRVFAAGLGSHGWFRCDPCVVRAHAFRQRDAAADITVRLGEELILPSVSIDEPGPYRPDQLVTLRGRGFQAHAEDFEIGWCQFVTDTPETEYESGSAGGTRCVYPEAGFAAVVDELGTFTLTGFPLPDNAFAEACRNGEARCGLAWYPSEGSLPAFTARFDLD